MARQPRAGTTRNRNAGFVGEHHELAAGLALGIAHWFTRSRAIPKSA